MLFKPVCHHKRRAVDVLDKPVSGVVPFVPNITVEKVRVI